MKCLQFLTGGSLGLIATLLLLGLGFGLLKSSPFDTDPQIDVIDVSLMSSHTTGFNLSFLIKIHSILGTYFDLLGIRIDKRYTSQDKL